MAQAVDIGENDVSLIISLVVNADATLSLI